MSFTPEYFAWEDMIKRCENPKTHNFYLYGGRGIRVCEEWRNSFVAFLAYIGFKSNSKLTLDRINNDGNYEPGNVRWATRSQQNINRRSPRRIIK